MNGNWCAAPFHSFEEATTRPDPCAESLGSEDEGAAGLIGAPAYSRLLEGRVQRLEDTIQAFTADLMAREALQEDALVKMAALFEELGALRDQHIRLLSEYAAESALVHRLRAALRNSEVRESSLRATLMALEEQIPAMQAGQASHDKNWLTLVKSYQDTATADPLLPEALTPPTMLPFKDYLAWLVPMASDKAQLQRAFRVCAESAWRLCTEGIAAVQGLRKTIIHYDMICRSVVDQRPTPPGQAERTARLSALRGRYATSWQHVMGMLRDLTQWGRAVVVLSLHAGLEAALLQRIQEHLSLISGYSVGDVVGDCKTIRSPLAELPKSAAESLLCGGPDTVTVEAVCTPRGIDDALRALAGLLEFFKADLGLLYRSSAVQGCPENGQSKEAGVQCHLLKDISAEQLEVLRYHNMVNRF